MHSLIHDIVVKRKGSQVDPHSNIQTNLQHTS
jgi:hypothetical protein